MNLSKPPNMKTIYTHNHKSPQNSMSRKEAKNIAI